MCRKIMLAAALLVFTAIALLGSVSAYHISGEIYTCPSCIERQTLLVVPSAPDVAYRQVDLFGCAGGADTALSRIQMHSLLKQGG